MKEQNKKLILVSNDDGYTAFGFQELCKIAATFGDVIAIAPTEGQSGKSHAITVSRPLRMYQVKQENNLSIYCCNGTPVDCVKLALNKLVPRKPDILLSGINHGANTSASVIYSGTMAAAREGSINNIPSIGFSYNDYSMNPDYTGVQEIIQTILSTLIEKPLHGAYCLNVNIPVIKNNHQGIRICRQTKGYWQEEFEQRKDPHGGDYYWLTGKFVNLESDAQDTDEWAMKNNYVSIVPVMVDTTDFSCVDQLRKYKW